MMISRANPLKALVVCSAGWLLGVAAAQEYKAPRNGMGQPDFSGPGPMKA